MTGALSKYVPLASLLHAIGEVILREAVQHFNEFSVSIVMIMRFYI